MYYFDGVHLTADSRDELHKIALNIGLQVKWFQDGNHPHYDVWGKAKDHLLKNATAREVAIQSAKLQKEH